jgi:hypothetical protein
VSGWLDRLRKRLDQASKPVTFFFRDDDAGWDDEALLWLLDIFGEEAAPLDLAVIPSSVDEALATTLLDRRGGTVRRLRFHQHGFRHVNHEATGRKCEFGPSRDRAEQAADIAAGRDRLRGLLAAALDPIFTPPWNRCSQTTVDVLCELGFTAISRDATAASLRLDGLVDVSIAVDWAERDHPLGPGIAAVGAKLAEAAAGRPVVGIMLHHAWLAGPDARALRELIRLLAGHGNARLTSMGDAVTAARNG